MIDIHGAEWLGPGSYRLVDSAECYEQYEVSFAAKVRCQWLPDMLAAWHNLYNGCRHHLHLQLFRQKGQHQP